MKQSIQTKNAFFFSHDSNARNDQKILKLRIKYGAEGYGIYFMLLEMLLESTYYELELDYDVLAFSLHARPEVIAAVVEDFDLFAFSADGKIFYSLSLKKRLESLTEIREKRRKAGIKSAEKRCPQGSVEPKVEHVLNTCSTHVGKNSNRVEKSRAEKSKEEERGVEQTKANDAVASEKASGFEPPTLTEIEKYCSQRNNEVKAGKFFDFYQSKGWMVGRNKMQDWQASIRNWEYEEQHKRRQQKTPNIANHNNRVVYEMF